MARRRRYGSSRWYPKSGPREAKGGIKAQSKRGAFAGKWWGQRWIEVLEGFDIASRLARGRTYARKGQVVDLSIEPGEVSASVQGSRARPYLVMLELQTLTDGEWEAVSTLLKDRPVIAASLLAGEMPPEIVEVFEQAEVALFPERSADLVTDCSCPDWSNPCKHIAAVYYLLAEAFDHDPFLLLRLRGIERDDLAPASGGAESAASQPILRGEPLPTDAETFWGTAPVSPVDADHPQAPTLSAPLVRRLGGFPFWRGRDNFLETMSDVCERASQTGRSIWSGESS